MKIPQFVKKLTGGVTLVCFMASSCPQPLLAATPGADASFQPLIVSKLAVPQETGTIEEFFQGNKPFQVVLIRDAHAIPQAQRNIQALIELFQKTYGIRRVGVEGATGEMDAQILRSFPQKEKLREVLNVYMERGEWTGVNGSAVFSGENTVYEGLEDWELYEQGLEGYQAALNQQPGLLSELARKKEKLQQDKQKIYSPALLKIDTAIERFETERAELGQALLTLSEVKKPSSPDLSAMLEGMKEEALEADDSVASELNELALRIKKKDLLKAEDKAVFNAKFQAYQIGQINAPEFAGYLQGIEPLPANLKKLAERHHRLQNLEGTQVMKDFEVFAQSVKESLFVNKNERDLDRKGKEIRLFERFARLELSREDWETLKKQKFQKDAWQKYDAFYKNAQIRESMMGEKLLTLVAKENVLVVAGGFHTEGLTQALKQQSISYAVIRPDIRALPEESFYRSQILGIFSWSGYFQAVDGRVNLYKAFIQALREDLLKIDSSAPTLKAWRDQLIRDLATEGRQGKISGYWSLLENGKNSNRESKDELRKKWIKSIDSFIEKFKSLKTQGNLTEEGILNILKPSTIPTGAGAVLFPGSEMREDLLAPQSRRSEVRIDENKFGDIVLDFQIKSLSSDWRPLGAVLGMHKVNVDQLIEGIKAYNEKHGEKDVLSDGLITQFKNSGFDFRELRSKEGLDLEERDVIKLFLYFNLKEDLLKLLEGKEPSMQNLKKFHVSDEGAQVLLDEIIRYLREKYEFQNTGKNRDQRIREVFQKVRGKLSTTGEKLDSALSFAAVKMPDFLKMLEEAFSSMDTGLRDLGEAVLNWVNTATRDGLSDADRSLLDEYHLYRQLKNNAKVRSEKFKPAQAPSSPEAEAFLNRIKESNWNFNEVVKKNEGSFIVIEKQILRDAYLSRLFIREIRSALLQSDFKFDFAAQRFGLYGNQFMGLIEKLGLNQEMSLIIKMVMNEKADIQTVVSRMGLSHTGVGKLAFERGHSVSVEEAMASYVKFVDWGREDIQWLMDVRTKNRALGKPGLDEFIKAYQLQDILKEMILETVYEIPVTRSAWTLRDSSIADQGMWALKKLSDDLKLSFSLGDLPLGTGNRPSKSEEVTVEFMNEVELKNYAAMFLSQADQEKILPLKGDLPRRISEEYIAPLDASSARTVPDATHKIQVGPFQMELNIPKGLYPYVQIQSMNPHHPWAGFYIEISLRNQAGAYDRAFYFTPRFLDQSYEDRKTNPDYGLDRFDRLAITAIKQPPWWTLKEVIKKGKSKDFLRDFRLADLVSEFNTDSNQSLPDLIKNFSFLKHEETKALSNKSFKVLLDPFDLENPFLLVVTEYQRGGKNAKQSVFRLTRQAVLEGVLEKVGEPDLAEVEGENLAKKNATQNETPEVKPGAYKPAQAPSSEEAKKLLGELDRSMWNFTTVSGLSKLSKETINERILQDPFLKRSAILEIRKKLFANNFRFQITASQGFGLTEKEFMDFVFALGLKEEMSLLISFVVSEKMEMPDLMKRIQASHETAGTLAFGKESPTLASYLRYVDWGKEDMQWIIQVLVKYDENFQEKLIPKRWDDVNLGQFFGLIEHFKLENLLKRRIMASAFEWPVPKKIWDSRDGNIFDSDWASIAILSREMGLIFVRDNIPYDYESSIGRSDLPTGWPGLKQTIETNNTRDYLRKIDQSSFPHKIRINSHESVEDLVQGFRFLQIPQAEKLDKATGREFEILIDPFNPENPFILQVTKLSIHAKTEKILYPITLKIFTEEMHPSQVKAIPQGEELQGVDPMFIEIAQYLFALHKKNEGGAPADVLAAPALALRPFKVSLSRHRSARLFGGNITLKSDRFKQDGWGNKKSDKRRFDLAISSIKFIGNEMEVIPHLEDPQDPAKGAYLELKLVLPNGKEESFFYDFFISDSRLFKARKINKEKKMSDKSQEIFEKYQLLDLATALAESPAEMQQTLAILLTQMGEDIGEEELGALNRAFALNLGEGHSGGGGKLGEGLRGDPYKYLQSLMGLQQILQQLKSDEQEVFIQAFLRLALQSFSKDFSGAMETVRKIIGETSNHPFFDALEKRIETIFKEAINYQPAHIRTSMLPHQKVGAWRARHSEEYQKEGVFGFLNEDDTRIGKTIETYAAMDMSWKSLIVVPAGVIDNWKGQYYRHVQNGAKLVVVRGNAAQKRKLLLENKDKKGVILLVGLEDMRHWDDEVFQAVNEGLDVAVVDEGQKMENYKGQDSKASSLQAKAIHRLKTKRKWALSATPFTSKGGQLFSVMNWIHTDPDTGEVSNPLYETPEQFNRYLTANNKQKSQFYTLKSRISIRRTKAEMGDTYSRKKLILPSELGAYALSPEQAELILRIIRNLGQYLEIYNKRVPYHERIAQNSVSSFLKLQFLEWAMTDPTFLGENIKTHYWEKMDEIVIPRLEAKRKGEIFVQNIGIADKIIERYEAKGFRVVRIDGTVSGNAVDENGFPVLVRYDENGKMILDPKGEPISQRDYYRHRFQDDPNVDLVVMNIRAAVGIDTSAADWELYAQLPKNYVEYYQSSDRSIGINPFRGTPNRKEVEVMMMMAEFPKEFLEAALETEDRSYVEHGTPAEIGFKLMMGEEKEEFEILMEGLPGSSIDPEKKAVARFVKSIYGFTEDPSFASISKKRKKKLENSSVLYPLYQKAEKDKVAKETVLDLVDFYSKTEISAQEFGKAIAESDGFDFEDLGWVKAIFGISNKQYRDSVLNLLPEVYKRVRTNGYSGISELIRRGPPALQSLSENQPELLIAFIAATHGWNAQVDSEDILVPAHPGAAVLVDVLNEFYSDGLSEYDQKIWVRRFVYSLMHLIDLEKTDLFDFLDHLSLDFGSTVSLQMKLEILESLGMLRETGKLPPKIKIEFFEDLGILRQADQEAYDAIIQMRAPYPDIVKALRRAARDTFVRLFNLPDTPETEEAILDLGRELGNLNAPIQMMAKLHAANPAEYREHVGLFEQIMRHWLADTLEAWRNKQEGEPHEQDISFLKNRPKFWEIFTREELVVLGNVTKQSAEMLLERKRDMDQLVNLFMDPEMLINAFGPVGELIFKDFDDRRSKEKLDVEIKQKGLARGLTDKSKKDEIKKIEDELRDLRLRYNIQLLDEALKGTDFKVIQGLLEKIIQYDSSRKEEELRRAPLQVAMEKLAENLDGSEKEKIFEDVEIEFTSNPDLILRRGMLHDELKNCFNLNANVKQIATLLDDIASKNKMLAIVRVKGKIAAVSILKVRNKNKDLTEEEPVIMIELPLARWGYKFENEIAAALLKSKLSEPEMKDTSVASTWTKSSSPTERIKLYPTGGRGPTEYHEALFGVRERDRLSVFHHGRMIIQPRSEVRSSDEVQSLAKRINEIELKLKTDVENSPEKFSELVPEINTAMTKAHELLIDYFLQARNFNGVSTFDEKTVKSLNHLAVSIFNLFHQLTRKRSLIYIDPSWAVLRAHQATEAISFLTSYARVDGVNALQFWGTVDWVAKIYAKRLKNFLKAYEAESPTLKQRDRLEHPGVAFNLAKKGLIIYFDYLEYLRELKPTPYPAELMPLSYRLSKMARLSVKLLFKMESSPEIESKFHNAAAAELSEFAARSIPLLTEISGQLQDPTPGTEDSNLQQFQYFKDTLRYLIAEFKTRSEVRVKQETDESELGELIGRLKIKGGEELEMRKGDSYSLPLKTIPGFNLYRKVQSKSGRPVWEPVLYYAYEKKSGTIYQFLSLAPAGSPVPRALLSWLAYGLKKENKKIHFHNVINPKMAALMEKIAVQIEVEIAFAPSQGWSAKPDWAKAEAILGNESKREFYVSGFWGNQIGKFQLQRDGGGYQLTSVADGWVKLSDNTFSLEHQYEIKGYELSESKTETKVVSKSPFTVKLENGAILIDAPVMDDTYPDPQISFYLPVEKAHPSFPYLKDYKWVDPREGARPYVVRTMGHLEVSPPSFRLEMSDGVIRFKGEPGSGTEKTLNFRNPDRPIKILFKDQKIMIDDPNPDQYLIFYSLMDRSTFTMRGEPNPIDVPEFTSAAGLASHEAESKRSEVRELGSEWIEQLEPVIKVLTAGNAKNAKRMEAFERLNLIAQRAQPILPILGERGNVFKDEEVENVAALMDSLLTGFAASAFHPRVFRKYSRDIDNGLHMSARFFFSLQSYLKNRNGAFDRMEILQNMVDMSKWVDKMLTQYRTMLVRTRKLVDGSIKEDPREMENRILFLGLVAPLQKQADAVMKSYFEILSLVSEPSEDQDAQAFKSTLLEALSDMSTAFMKSVDFFVQIQNIESVDENIRMEAKTSLGWLESTLDGLHDTTAYNYLSGLASKSEDTEHRAQEILDAISSVQEETKNRRSETRQVNENGIYSNKLLKKQWLTAVAGALRPVGLGLTNISRSELREASQGVANLRMPADELRAALMAEMEQGMAYADIPQPQKILDQNIARTLAIQAIEANLLKTLSPGNLPESPFAFGTVLPEKNSREFASLFVKAVRPGAVVMVEGKLPGGFDKEIRSRGGQIRPESMDKAIELPGNQPDAAIVLEGGLSEIFHEMFRPFLLDPKNLDPEVRHLGVTLLSVAAAHYGMLVSKDPSLKLKPEALKNELLKRLQQFEKFPDLFEILSSGKTWGLSLVSEKLEEFISQRAMQVAA